MNFEVLLKYYFLKFLKLSDDVLVIGIGCLIIMDVMAVQGMVQLKVLFGLVLFLVKVGVQDFQFVIEGLLNYVMVLDNLILNKLSEEIWLQIIFYFVSFVFVDYFRFAVSKVCCEYCLGMGFYNVLCEVVKYYRCGEFVIKEEWVKELCQYCYGKGEVSIVCRGCKGKGIVLDEKRIWFYGVLVYKICGCCNGNWFSCLLIMLV